MTILKTQSAIINGKKVIVDTIKGNKGKQDLFYKIGDYFIGFDNFWALNPQFSN